MQCLDLYFTILTGSLLITENLACNIVFTRDQLITLRLSFVAGEKLTIPVEIVGLQCNCQREDEEKGDINLISQVYVIQGTSLSRTMSAA